MGGVAVKGDASTTRKHGLVVGALIIAAATLISVAHSVEPAAAANPTLSARQSSAGEITVTWNYDSAIPPQSQRVRILEEQLSKTGAPQAKPKVVASKILPKGATRHVTRNLVTGKNYLVELISTSPALKLTSKVQLVGKPAVVAGLRTAWVDTEMIVSWRVPRAADTTLVGIAVTSTAGFRREAAAAASAGEVRIIGVDPRATYTVYAVAKNAAGTGPLTQISTSTGLPGRPTVTASPNGIGNITLTWTATGNPVSQWIVQLVAPGQARHNESVIVTGKTTVTLTGLTAGAQYGFKVTGRSNLGDGPSSALVTMTAPEPLPRPTKPVATPTATAVKVSWTPVIVNGGVVVSYRIGYRLLASGEWSYTPATETTSTTITGLNAGRQYELVVEASTVDARTSLSLATFVRLINETPLEVPPSDPTAPGTAETPTKPAIPSARLDGFADRSAVTLLWDEQSTPVKISYRTAGGAWVNVEVASTSTTISGLTNGMQYEFVLVRAGDATALSPAITLTPVGKSSQPVGLSATPRHSEIELRWSSPVDSGGTTLNGYQITYRGSSGYGQLFLDPSTNSVIVTGLTNGDTYVFTVRLDTQLGEGETATVSATPSFTSTQP